MGVFEEFPLHQANKYTNTTNNGRLMTGKKAELPMTHSLRIFDILELKFNPFKFVLFMELTF